MGNYTPYGIVNFDYYCWKKKWQLVADHYNFIVTPFPFLFYGSEKVFFPFYYLANVYHRL